MIEFAHASILLMLVCAVGFLLYDRRRIHSSIEEKDRGEMVTQAELDSYHHRVVQLYQTQRDWCRGKFEEADHRLRQIEKSVGDGTTRAVSPPLSDEVSVTDVPSPVERTEPEIFPITDLFLSSASQEDPPTVEPAPDVAGEMESFATAEEKVLKAWTAGRSVDQIAQELRMGRQEVQLLIQVSRRKPAGPVGA